MRQRTARTRMRLAAVVCKGERARVVIETLRTLFAAHGQPLAMKFDNGPGFKAHATTAMLEESGVQQVASPVYKHNWLFLNSLDSEARVRHLVAFYVAEHNQRLPHAAFKGQTPDEMYFGTGDAVPDQLAAARVQARQTRLEENRAKHCALCN